MHPNNNFYELMVGSITPNKGKFSPFSLLVDGMMGKEAQVVLATLSQLMAAKIKTHFAC